MVSLQKTYSFEIDLINDIFLCEWAGFLIFLLIFFNKFTFYNVIKLVHLFMP